MNFEWDMEKARNNLRKHGVGFMEASSVFYDPLAVTGLDPDHSIGEERLITYGMSSLGRLLLVVHTERGENLRIITARVATANERVIYEEG